MNKFLYAFLTATILFCLLPATSLAQTPAWLVDINQELDLLEDNLQSCNDYIKDVQAEIDHLIKTSPKPITGSPAEKKIRDLQRQRFAAKCFRDKTEKAIRRLKAIRDVLKKRWGTAGTSAHVKTEIQKTQKKCDQVEQKAQANDRAAKKAQDTVDQALKQRR
ncbi:MAG: hypothetical protein AAFR61_15470 [Bacteroidota bacterium]